MAPTVRTSNLNKELFTLVGLCVSSLRRGHANLLCIVPILTDDPRRESDSQISKSLSPHGQICLGSDIVSQRVLAGNERLWQLQRKLGGSVGMSRPDMVLILTIKILKCGGKRALAHERLVLPVARRA